MKKDYEFMVIIKPMLPEDIRTGVEKKMKKIIESHKGEVLSEEVWGKKHLAYPISGHDEGYYIVYKLKLVATTVNEISAEMKVINDVLRFIIIDQDNQ